MVTQDYRGSQLEVGDFVVRLSDSGRSLAGYIKEFVGGRDGRARVLLSGTSKRPILTEKLISVSALGISLQATDRDEVFPERPSEYNRDHLCDVRGYEARAGDHVIFCRSGKFAQGTILHFGRGTVALQPNDWPPNHITSRLAGQFLICYNE